jgi:hypothetical protein
MDYTLQSKKLAVLREKTDLQLVAYVSRRLEQGIEIAGNQPDRAEELYAEATALLPVVGASKRERARLQSMAERLRRALDDAGGRAMPARAACF